MITLNNIHKFFNKGKSNQFHVVNDTSVTFAATGLTAITGPSGCGKTTLLNIIGGLDAFERGDINFDGHIIKKYRPNHWDILRNKYVGYIFQNYNLVSDKTVYENIEITLNMAGIYDHQTVEQRIHYVLKSVGLYNYRKRNVLALSGGQQQRVAIARALAKNPKVILADEPTGNLDAHNTYEVMRLIKKISKTCLVILVSHEKELVTFYADRIIELLDGRIIKDYENKGEKSLVRFDERKIYLKDLAKEEEEGLAHVSSYYLEKPSFKPDVKLIYFNNTVYVRVDSDTRVKYIDDDSEVHLIDDHYKEEQSDAEDHLFDMSSFGYVSWKAKRKSFIRFKDALRDGLLKILTGRKIYNKLFLVAFFVISMIIVNNLATFANLTRIEESDYVYMPKSAVAITIEDGKTYDDYDRIHQLDSDPFLMLQSQNVSMYFSYEDLYQASGLYRGAIARVSAYPVPISYMGDNQMFLGRLPEGNDEIAMDLWIADAILNSKEASDIGISTYEELLEGEVLSFNREYGNLTIVGIVETHSPIVIISDDNAFYFSQSEVGAMGSIRKQPTMIEGTYEVGDGEVLVNESTQYEVGDIVYYQDRRFEVTGIFTDANYVFIISNDMFLETGVRNMMQTQLGYDLIALSNDKELTVSELQSLGFEARDVNASDYERFKENQQLAVASRVRNIVLILGGILVYIFLMMRSSMLGRIKEIGIYRSIGATKKDIYKIFVSEIIAFTTVGGLSGYLLMSYLVSRVQSIVGDLFRVYYFPVYLFIVGILVIYLANIVFGMLPIMTLLRKTPSEIMAKYDI